MCTPTWSMGWPRTSAASRSITCDVAVVRRTSSAPIVVRTLEAWKPDCRARQRNGITVAVLYASQYSTRSGSGMPVVEKWTD